MVKIKDLHLEFSDHVVFDNLSLELSKDSIVGLAGSSGSGKSTLLRVIQGLQSYGRGEVEIQGECSFMFQDFQLFPNLTVLENLTFAANLSYPNLPNVRRANSLLADLNLKEKKSQYPNFLSGGQKQRVALARALMMNPDILLCDEPTSGLDIATIDDVISVLKQVSHSGKMMIIASHDLDFLTKIADRIIILKSGKIVKDVVTKKLANPIKNLKQYY